MLCSVDGCDGAVVARSWCNLHYRRWRRTGAPGPARRPVTAEDCYVDENTRRLPCRDRLGGVRAWALVDADDFDRLRQHDWHYGGRYVRRGLTVDGVRVQLKLHREVMHLRHDSSVEVDHIDRDPLNNRRSNLRVLALGLNQQNASKAKGKTSRHRGVSLSNGTWLAMVTHDGKQHYAGRHATEQEAADAAAALRRRLLPFATE